TEVNSLWITTERVSLSHEGQELLQFTRCRQELPHSLTPSGAVVAHGGGGHPEGAVPGVAEARVGAGLDPAAVGDEVVAAGAAEQARVHGHRAGEALGAEAHGADGAAAGVAHRHLEHRVVPGPVARVGLRHRHARRRAPGGGGGGRGRRVRRRWPSPCTRTTPPPCHVGQQPPQPPPPPCGRKNRSSIEAVLYTLRLDEEQEERREDNQNQQLDGGGRRLCHRFFLLSVHKERLWVLGLVVA
uniref:Uncharacterized protein n=1 Tax=Zea mays TaxID=4577 RepID=A0A804NLS6_MAIZE